MKIKKFNLVNLKETENRIKNIVSYYYMFGRLTDGTQDFEIGSLGPGVAKNIKIERWGGRGLHIYIPSVLLQNNKVTLWGEIRKYMPEGFGLSISTEENNKKEKVKKVKKTYRELKF